MKNKIENFRDSESTSLTNDIRLRTDYLRYINLLTRFKFFSESRSHKTAWERENMLATMWIALIVPCV